jgi:hypothetical protein
MMDVLPPKWTELFQHQQQQEIVEQHQEHNESTRTHKSCHWNTPEHYNTYHNACTIHPIHDHHRHLPNSPRKFRTHSYSSNPSSIEPLSFVNKDGETQLRGTRFRLTKATIRIDDEDEDQQHQQLNSDHHYV